MLTNPDAEAMIQDAREAQAAGERLMAAGDWRDAAEKGWLAARNATAAVVLEVTGVDNSNTSGIATGIRHLAHQRGGEWALFRRDYGQIAQHLHSDAFYRGIYQDDIADRVRSVADYIALAVELAGG